MPETCDLFLSYGRGDDDPDFTDPTKSFLRCLYNDLTVNGEGSCLVMAAAAVSPPSVYGGS